MLFKLSSSNEEFGKLEPVEFKDFSSFGRQEKELEELIAKNILEVLFEDSSLMPIFQERQYQSEADIYALNEQGELIIFELKRGSASEDALYQVLGYAQKAGQWTYSKLQDMYQKYTGENKLTKAHQEAFNLEEPLDAKELNNKQHLIVIGSAADDSLISAVDYWKRSGISIEFLPYRIYELGDEKYFEFFALPYDKHMNPIDVKGVLFDTNTYWNEKSRYWNEKSIWYMMENKRVAAFGKARRFVGYVKPGDIIFFSDRKAGGLVAAAKVKGDVKHSAEDDASYRDVEFITPIPERGEEKIKAMPFRNVLEITGISFYWARTIKVPYLSKEQAENLVDALNEWLRNEAHN